ncbi:uncharacterized protein Z520_06698 [Fonsecaea multimorphosa CBS 102226]|uniref:DUF7730 domain-containing protein n=1 Tax=Fonsecaea multimorphosa CBS 102226 TaxID=1442371 RepID=A0A0D2H7Y3_9EURO|nr:uncharacterized protein Z520_06698 [Fonsecaea multimorphosa CBS 102226]KIX97920.1 hypothetical protein Z520_06698 [Fonsecaea multimorphosa CBS 102226]OAL23689.1 hypothetical protein AYO22_06266 [Fonsecaea multimorphosa]
MSSSKSKRNRTLPHRNRQHVLRPIAQPQGPPAPRPQAETRPPPSGPVAKATRPAPSRSSKSFPFFKLPGEIRNRIYDLVVPEARVIISANHPQKELQLMRQREPCKKHKPPPHRLLGQFTGNATEASLFLTCRQMNREAVRFIYSRTTFCFDRVVVLRSFLKTVPEEARASIRALEITHVGYAEPRLLDDRRWKLRHDTKWAMVLRQIQHQVTALRHLRLNVTFFDWPCRLDVSEKWARPYLELAGEGGLLRVEFTLAHECFHEVKVAATAKELENKMMSAEGKKAKRREAEMERKRLEESKRKATRALKIKLPLGDNLPNVNLNMPTKKVVKSKGLEQYAVKEPPCAYC